MVARSFPRRPLVTGSLDFVVASAGAAITIMMELTRTFDLATDAAFDLASGATGLALSILNGGAVIFDPRPRQRRLRASD